VETNLVLQVIAAVFGLAGQYFVNKQKVTGFYLWLLSNAALIVFQVMHQFWVFVGLHIVYFIMALHGIYVWKGGSFFNSDMAKTQTPVAATVL
jgi:nicotinamide riboside transporter PnuC